MAIALNFFEGLCGFRPYNEIKFFLDGMLYLFIMKNNNSLYIIIIFGFLFFHLEIPEFRILVGYELIDQFINDNFNSESLLKDIFYKLMTSEKEIIAQNISSHKKNLQSLCKLCFFFNVLTKLNL